MPDAWLPKLVLVVVASALLTAIVRVLRGEPAPQFADQPNPRVGVRPPANDQASGSGQGELHLVPAVAASPAPTASPSGTWAEPVDGACPPGFPVKAKLTSGIFHVPGGLSYDRTNPDRCYPTLEAALADGLRAAKR